MGNVRSAGDGRSLCMHWGNGRGPGGIRDRIELISFCHTVGSRLDLPIGSPPPQSPLASPASCTRSSIHRSSRVCSLLSISPRGAILGPSPSAALASSRAHALDTRRAQASSTWTVCKHAAPFQSSSRHQQEKIRRAPAAAHARNQPRPGHKPHRRARAARCASRTLREPPAGQGERRFGSLGKSDDFRMLESAQKSITTRSRPMPPPACGKAPYLKELT